MVNEAVILAAIDDIKTQMNSNYGATAKKYNINQNTLQHCYKNEIISKNITQLKIQKLFNNVYGKMLIKCVNIFSIQNIFSTLAMVHNLILELIGTFIGKH